VAGLLVSLASCEDATQPPAAAPTPAVMAPASPPLPGADEPVRLLRLPADTRPTAEAIELHVDPRADRFSGVVEIDVTLTKPRAVFWLHGRKMNVTGATVTPTGGTPLPATWKERDDHGGVAALTLASAVPAGRARIHLAFDAAYEHGQSGLYKVSEGGAPYAFTQFEAIAARRAFPCFDEPGFKIPFTTTLVVPADLEAVANTHEVSRARDGASQRIVFAPTLPLPSYLVAFAVGSFDIVAAPDVPPNAVRTRALPLRAVTAKGRGKEIAYALAHTGEILATLEKYFGLEYPYDKLDILAVPGKGGAMENAGAVTFGEALLLMDPKTASIGTRRSYAGVMAHELAHQWTGDLVTMEWWDDTWLNEAFATFVGNKAAEAWDPKTHADLGFLRSIQGAMSADALMSARAIRQPIASIDDIQNAFDSITYQKGGGVLAMFEHWAGPELWQKGLHDHLVAHRFGNATADDFLEAENTATGKDIKTAFHTFLDQPGLPLVEAALTCDKGQAPVVKLKQSRFVPLGSSGDSKKAWQIPVCVRTDHGAPSCALLTEAQGEVRLGAGGASGECPKWAFANADGAGYYRLSFTAEELQGFAKAGTARFAAFSTREKMAFGASARGAYSRGVAPYKDVLDAVASFAKEPEPTVAEDPMSYLNEARSWLYDDPLRPRVEAYTARLYGPVFAKLGWTSAASDDDERRALRGAVLSYLALTGRDAAVRKEANKRGLAYIGFGKDSALHPEAVDPNLAASVLAVLGEDADKATWEAMKTLFSASVEEVVRARLLYGLALARDPALSAAARELVLDPQTRESEMLRPLVVQLEDPGTREAAWAWVLAHYDALIARLPARRGSALITLGRAFCDEKHADEVAAYFGPKIASLEGGPRALASTVEEVRLCAARKKTQEPSARERFGRPSP
jgi:alanyl aminopeptidase